MAIFRLERPQQGRRMQVGHAEIAILSQYLVPSRAVNAKCNTLSRDGPQRVDDTSRFSKRRCLLMAGDDNEVYAKKPERYAVDNTAAFNCMQWYI